MDDFELPANLVLSGQECGGATSSRRAWLADLPRTVDDLARRWSLDVGRPFQPGGTAAWVAPAHTSTGERVVLKAGWRHDEALHEADGLRVWAGRGAVRLLEALTVGETSALLLEACEPGTLLARALPPAEQDDVVAGLLRRLWVDPPTDHPFRGLESMCARWADEFEQKYTAAAPRGFRLDRGQATAGIELLRSLSDTAARRVLLCTDLHPDNVIAARREPWLMIDPKPYVGDPTYDPIQHMLNFPDRLAVEPLAFVRRMAALLDLDAERLRQWLFARCVQESVDQPYLLAAVAALAP